MAIHYTCDECHTPLDKVTSIQSGNGMLYIPLSHTSIDVKIHLSITNPGMSASDICFSCIVGEMAIQIRKRKEVITEKPK